MDIDARQNELSREDQTQKKKEGGVARFFVEADIESMDAKFIISYRKHKKQIDELRGQLGQLEDEVKRQEAKKIKTDNELIKQLSQVVAELDNKIFSRQNFLVELNVEIVKKQKDRAASKNIYEKKLSEVELQKKKVEKNIESYQKEHAAIKSLVNRNEALLKKIDTEELALKFQRRETGREKQTFLQMVDFTNKKFIDKRIKIEFEEKKTEEILKQAEIYFEKARTKKDEVISIVHRLAEVQQRENNVSGVEKENENKVEEINQDIINNKIKVKKNIEQSELLDKREKMLDKRENNVKLLESKLVSKL